MPLFKVVRDALPAEAVALARSVVVDMADRKGGKFDFGSVIDRSEDGEAFLALAKAFLDGPVPEIFRAQHGVEPALCLSITSVRRQEPATSERKVDWHLDLNFVGDFKPFMVAWTAIEDVGSTRTSLDIGVPTGKPMLLEPVLRELILRTDRGDPAVFSTGELDGFLGADAWTSRSVVAPAGSAAVFDQMILHRTQDNPGATEVRHSIEFRMMDIDDLPAHQLSQTALYAKRSAQGGLDLFIVKDGQRLPFRPTAARPAEAEA